MSDASVPFSHPWPEDLMGNLGKVTVGGTPSTAVSKYWDGGDVPWMASGDVHLKRITDVPGRITQLGLRRSNTTLVDPPAVAVGLAGQGKTRGTVALVLCMLSTNQSVALITTNSEKLDAEYLFYNLQFRYDELRSRSAGGGRAGLTKQLLEQVPVPLPLATEQRKIAEILSAVDLAIRQSDDLIAKQRRIKTGLTEDLLTRGIDETGNLRSEKTHEFKDSPVGRIPAEWLCEELSHFVPSAEYGISTPLGDTGYPVLRMNNLSEGHAVLSDLKFTADAVPDKLWLRDKDVLFNRTNSREHVGRTGIWRGECERATFASYLVRLNCDPNALSCELLNIWLNWSRTQIAMRRLATPAVQQVNINPTNLRKLLAALPSCIGEQEQIVERLNSLDSALRKTQRVRDKLALLKTALMQDFLRGRKRVTVLLKPSVHLAAEAV